MTPCSPEPITAVARDALSYFGKNVLLFILEEQAAHRPVPQIGRRVLSLDLDWEQLRGICPHRSTSLACPSQQCLS